MSSAMMTRMLGVVADAGCCANEGMDDQSASPMASTAPVIASLNRCIGPSRVGHFGAERFGEDGPCCSIQRLTARPRGEDVGFNRSVAHMTVGGFFDLIYDLTEVVGLGGLQRRKL